MGDENILKVVGNVIQLCKYTKNDWIAHLYKVNFMLCEMYLSKAIILKILFLDGVLYNCIFFLFFLIFQPTPSSDSGKQTGYQFYLVEVVCIAEG